MILYKFTKQIDGLKDPCQQHFRCPQFFPARAGLPPPREQSLP